MKRKRVEKGGMRGKERMVKGKRVRHELGFLKKDSFPI